jgi:hypothetical protein
MCMKNVSIIWTEKVQLRYRRYLVENKAEYGTSLKNAVNLLFAEIPTSF